MTPSRQAFAAARLCMLNSMASSSKSSLKCVSPTAASTQPKTLATGQEHQDGVETYQESREAPGTGCQEEGVGEAHCACQTFPVTCWRRA